MHSAQRTLVKSAPELWSEVSDPDTLGRRLAAFGEIRITELEPEATVAWEGDRARGTVRLEPAGRGRLRGGGAGGAGARASRGHYGRAPGGPDGAGDGAGADGSRGAARPPRAAAAGGRATDR